MTNEAKVREAAKLEDYARMVTRLIVIGDTDSARSLLQQLATHARRLDVHWDDSTEFVP